MSTKNNNSHLESEIRIETYVKSLPAKKIDTQQYCDYAVVRVTDTGCGMDEEMQKRIFEPFFTTKSDVGSGLGLTSAFSIMEQHNGWIECRSQFEKGTVFEIFFPVNQDITPNKIS